MIRTDFIFACRAIALLRKETDSISGRIVAKRLSVKCRYGEASLQTTRRFGLIDSYRGPAGGYVITHKGLQASLLDVFRLYHPDCRLLERLVADSWKDELPDRVAEIFADLKDEGLV